MPPRSVAPILSILPAMIAGSLSADGDLATPAASLETLLVTEHVPEDIRQELALFKKLAMDFDELRQYALFNFIAVMKVVKKHDKLSTMPLRDTLAGYVINQPFFTGERLLRAFEDAPEPAPGLSEMVTDAAVLFLLGVRSHGVSTPDAIPACTVSFDAEHGRAKMALSA